MPITHHIKKRLESLLPEVEEDLRFNILPFWYRLKTPQGFLGGLYNDLRIAEGDPVSLVMVSRILWTYARAYRAFGDPVHRSFAEQAHDYLLNAFYDKVNGGYAWWTSTSGVVLDNKKQTYGQAFVIYAMAEYFMAVGDDAAIGRARELFSLMEHHCWNAESGGYWEAVDNEWGALEDVRLSEKDMNAPLTMNTHLHVMEAYVNLLLADRDPAIEGACRKVISVVIQNVLHQEGDRFGLFYDTNWNLLTDAVSPGHDIEGSWLLWEAAEILRDRELMRQVRPIVVAMVDRVLDTGVSGNGSVRCEYEPGSIKSSETEWWPQAEGVVGFLNAFQMTGDAKYLDACEKTWDYIRNDIIDPVNGEWLAGRQVNGEPVDIEKAGPWKACYHNGRMGLEVINRISAIMKEPPHDN